MRVKLGEREFGFIGDADRLTARHRAGGGSEVEMRVLGADGSWPGPGGATSGYLVGHQGFHLWIDLGVGTFSRVQELTPQRRIDAALISHAHTDHFLDLYMLFYARHFAPEPPPQLPLYMPTGAFDRIAAAAGDRTEEVRRTFEINEIAPGAELDVGPFRIRTRPMRHSVPTLGMRVEAGGDCLAYTADTAPTDEIVAIAGDAEVLLAESTYLETDERAPLHLTARQAGEFAARSGAGSLLLTHLWPTVDPQRAVSEAAGPFQGNIAVAEEGMRIDSGGASR